MKLKRYKRCHQLLPATTDYFHLDKRRPGVLRGTCRECLKTYKRNRRLQVSAGDIKEVNCGYTGPVFDPTSCCREEDGQRVLWTGPWEFGTVVGRVDGRAWVQLDGRPAPVLIARSCLEYITPEQEAAERERVAAEFSRMKAEIAPNDTSKWDRTNRGRGKIPHTPMRQCRSCGRVLPIASFTYRKAANYYCPDCKQCSNRKLSERRRQKREAV